MKRLRRRVRHKLTLLCFSFSHLLKFNIQTKNYRSRLRISTIVHSLGNGVAAKSIYFRIVSLVFCQREKILSGDVSLQSGQMYFIQPFLREIIGQSDCFQAQIRSVFYKTGGVVIVLCITNAGDKTSP